MDKKIIRLVTRQSNLALWQAHHVKDRLQAHHPHLLVELIGITTEGDTWLETPLYKIGGKALFVKALEEQLLTEEADLAVHSMKDLPAVLPQGLGLVAITKREDPHDAFVCPTAGTLADLPAGAIVGTSSLRRGAQLQRAFPTLKIEPLRGNVNTRLQKLDDGQYDAIILAAAGLKRLGFANRITESLPTQMMLPAVGQGALGLECRTEDKELKKLLACLHHAPSAQCILAERAMNLILEGSCQVPVAGFATIDAERLHLEGRVIMPGGKRMLRACAEGSLKNPEALGEQVAHALLAQGARAMIDEILAGV